MYIKIPKDQTPTRFEGLTFSLVAQDIFMVVVVYRSIYGTSILNMKVYYLTDIEGLIVEDANQEKFYSLLSFALMTILNKKVQENFASVLDF